MTDETISNYKDNSINRFLTWSYKFLMYCTYIYTPNPGFNLTAVLTLSGFSVMAFSILAAQFGYGTPDPVLVELGKAAFFSGMGRASQQAEMKTR